jgi:hypothetical protein
MGGDRPAAAGHLPVAAFAEEHHHGAGGVDLEQAEPWCARSDGDGSVGGDPGLADLPAGGEHPVGVGGPDAPPEPLGRGHGVDLGGDLADGAQTEWPPGLSGRLDEGAPRCRRGVEAAELDGGGLEGGVGRRGHAAT